MMRRSTAMAALCAAILVSAAQPPAPPQPKLVVAIVIDQFRGDFVGRFRPEFTSGFARLIQQGAWLSNAFFEQYPTVTAVGHSQVLSGAMPAESGIIANEWYDRKSGKEVSNVGDDTTQRIGGTPGIGSSPQRLLVSTVGDELVAAGRAGQVIGISHKDRAAILPSSHAANAAYWFQDESGRFVSSTYYMAALPPWLQKHNDARPEDRWLGKEWTPLAGGAPFVRFSTTPDLNFYLQIYASPFGNEVVEELAELAIVNEKLGQGGKTDLLTIGFSSNDTVGHKYGPDSAQMHDITLRTDRLLGRFFDFLDKKIGLKNILIVVTADHGASPSVEKSRQLRLPAGSFSEREVLSALETVLVARYGAGPWTKWRLSEGMIWLDRERIAKSSLSLEEVQRTAADALAAMPFAERVYTASDLAHGRVNRDLVGEAMLKGYHPERSADVFVIQKPYWLNRTTGSGHYTPYVYDSYVPIFFLGPGIRPGNYSQRVSVADIAPTLAWMLGLLPPSGARGRVLSEILAH